MEKEVVLKTYIHRYEADIAKGLLILKCLDLPWMSMKGHYH
jgi:hypothetical protein